MKRRLDLAAALVHNPDILFLDEPTTGLDQASRAPVWEEVRRLNSELGMTIFLTTQYLEEADSLAHRVGIIDRGKIVAEGTPTDLKRAVGASHRCPPRRRSDRDHRRGVRHRRRPGRRGPRQRARHHHGCRVGDDQPGRRRPRQLRGPGARSHAAHADARRRFLEMTGSRIERDRSDSEEATR
jgi:ABC-type multidrug transport system ATPase subunit